MEVCRCGEALAARVEVEPGLWFRFCPNSSCGREWLETLDGLVETYFGAGRELGLGSTP